MGNFTRWLVLLGLFALVFYVILPFGKSASDREVERFHVRFNGGEYRGMYDDLAPQLKSHITEKEFVSRMESARSGLGVHQSSDNVGLGTMADFHLSPLHKFYERGVILICRSQFDNGVFRERFKLLIKGNRALIYSYEYEPYSRRFGKTGDVKKPPVP